MVNRNIEQEDDDCLLLYMSYKDEDPENAKLALSVFYERYKEYVAQICGSILKNLVDGKDKDDLFSEVFKRVFDRAETFDIDSAVDSDNLRTSIELWIMRIAKNMAIDWRRKNKTRREKYEEYHPIYSQQKQNDKTQWIPLDEEATKCFNMEFEKLSERDRQVIIQTGLYFDLDRGKSNLPSEVVEQIANEFGTTPDNIRQIRSRFMRRVRKKSMQD